jgi:tetratricopeptide (TPR) repeat protein
MNASRLPREATPHGGRLRALRLILSLSPPFLLAGIIAYGSVLIASARTELKTVQDSLAQKSDALARTQADLDEKQREKAALQAELESTRQQLEHLKRELSSNDPKFIVDQVRKQLGGRSPGERADALWRRGNDAYDGKKPELAETLYTAALAEQDSFAPALNGLGRINADRGNLLMSEKFYKRAIEKDPRYTHARFNLAHLYFYKFRDPEKAESYLQQTLSLDPEYAGAADLLKKVEAARASGRK